MERATVLVADDQARGVGVRFERLVDADRLTALLRTIAVPVLLIGESSIPRQEATEREFLAALAVFAVYALATLIGARRLGSGRRVWIGLLAADVLFAGVLSYTSGGGYSQLRFVFLFPMVTAAFRRIPAVTGLVVAASIVVYVLQAWPHPTRAHHNGGLSFIVVQTVYLAWIGAGMTSLSLLLARREAAIRRLSAQRQRLVAEALTAEERERKQLAEDLHDGPIQNLLAARHSLTAGAKAHPHGSEAQALRGRPRPRAPALCEQAPRQCRPPRARNASPRHADKRRTLRDTVRDRQRGGLRPGRALEAGAPGSHRSSLPCRACRCARRFVRIAAGARRRHDGRSHPAEVLRVKGGRVSRRKTGLLASF